MGFGRLSSPDRDSGPHASGCRARSFFSGRTEGASGLAWNDGTDADVWKAVRIGVGAPVGSCRQ